jgi:hypothetical protein
MTNYKAIAASYGRAFLAAAIACYLAGVTDPKALLAAGLAAILPPLLRWISPSDSTFGYVKVKDNNEH